jgi:hypothetical protein
MLGGIVIKRLLPYVAGILLLMGAFLYARYDAYNDGVAATVAKYEAAMQKERERLQTANEQALEEARQVEKELNRLLRERNERIGKLLLEAASDPRSEQPSVSVDGVRRLNQIR